MEVPISWGVGARQLIGAPMSPRPALLDDNDNQFGHESGSTLWYTAVDGDDPLIATLIRNAPCRKRFYRSDMIPCMTTAGITRGYGSSVKRIAHPPFAGCLITTPQ